MTDLPHWQFDQTQPALIPGLPENLRTVPEDGEVWKSWAQAVAAYRELRRRACEKDVRQQEIERERCRRDPAYFLTVWGVIFEPRKVDGNPPAWKPFILFPVQVRVVRWYQHTRNQEEFGRGDGILEKSRDMGATNIFCGLTVHGFLFEDVFICGIISRVFDAVYKKNSSDTIFYKIQAQLGVEDAVPRHLRLPWWMRPRNFDRDIHIAPGAIRNPEEGKTCFIVGETTTEMSGVGGRATVRWNDEAARFRAFGEAWSNQQAVTDHRFALSSADMESPEFRDMAILGAKCEIDPELEGPAFMRLDWWKHPFHTKEWYERQKARARTDGTLGKFNREYNIDYFSEQGDNVYPRFGNVSTVEASYDPLGGPLYCFVDPGIADPASFVYVQLEQATSYLNIVNGFQGKGGEDVNFYASVITGTYLSGDNMYDYDQYEGIHPFMEWVASIAQPIIYLGDPAGTQRGAGGTEKSTWYMDLTLACKKLSNRQVFVQSITAHNARAFNTRIKAVNELLPRMRFNRNLGASHVLECMKQSRYPEIKNVNRTTERLVPKHDKYSHARSAVEWGCVYLVLMGEQSLSKRQEGPVRVSLAGNVVSGRQKSLYQRR